MKALFSIHEPSSYGEISQESLESKECSWQEARSCEPSVYYFESLSKPNLFYGDNNEHLNSESVKNSEELFLQESCNFSNSYQEHRWLELGLQKSHANDTIEPADFILYSVQLSTPTARAKNSDKGAFTSNGVSLFSKRPNYGSCTFMDSHFENQISKIGLREEIGLKQVSNEFDDIKLPNPEGIVKSESPLCSIDYFEINCLQADQSYECCSADDSFEMNSNNSLIVDDTLYWMENFYNKHLTFGELLFLRCPDPVLSDYPTSTKSEIFIPSEFDHYAEMNEMSGNFALVEPISHIENNLYPCLRGILSSEAPCKIEQCCSNFENSNDANSFSLAIESPKLKSKIEFEINSHPLFRKIKTQHDKQHVKGSKSKVIIITKFKILTT